MTPARHDDTTAKTALRQRREAGVGLIEVLIAVLVFAVGVLGMVAMQVSAKRNGYEATQRSVATSLARDILERMRSNPGQLDAYEVTNQGEIASVAKDCSATGVDCTPAELAAYDLYDWSRLLAGASSRVTIDGSTSNAGGLVNSLACISNDNGDVTVELSWRGVDRLEDPNDPVCGKGSGLYDADVAGDNLLRRVMVMTTYIVES